MRIAKGEWQIEFAIRTQQFALLLNCVTVGWETTRQNDRNF